MNRWLFLVLVGLTAIGCSSKDPIVRSGGVVTLSPALTEVVFAIGRGDRLVGCTTACDYPPEAAKVPRVTDYRLNVEAVLSVRPGLVLADLTVNTPQELDRLEALGVRVERFSPTTLAATTEMIRKVGGLLHAEAAAERVARTLERPSHILTPPPRVLFTLGKDGLYVAGSRSLTADCVRAAGGQVMADDQAKFYPASREAILYADPEVIFTTGNPKEFLDDLQWRTCTAVKRNAVYHVDASLTTRPGPRLVQGIERMARLLRDQFESRAPMPREASRE